MKKVLSIVIALAMIVGTVSALGIFAHAEDAASASITAADLTANDYNNATATDTAEGIKLQGTNVKYTYSQKIPVNTEGFEMVLDADAFPADGWMVIGLSDTLPIQGWGAHQTNAIVMVVRVDTTDGWTALSGLSYGGESNYPVHSLQTTMPFTLTAGQEVAIEAKVVGETYEIYFNGTKVATHSFAADAFAWLDDALAEGAMLSWSFYSASNGDYDVTVKSINGKKGGMIGADQFTANAEHNNSTATNTEEGVRLQGNRVRHTFSQKIPVNTEGFKMVMDADAFPADGWMIVSLSDTAPIIGWGAHQTNAIVMVVRVDTTDGWTALSGLSYGGESNYPVHSLQSTMPFTLTAGQEVAIEVKVVDETYEVYYNNTLVATHSFAADAFAWLDDALAEGAMLSWAFYSASGAADANYDVTVKSINGVACGGVADDNTGDDNTGDDDTGDDNTGDDNTGDDNTGDDNTGDDNTGDDNTGDDNTGDEATGLFAPSTSADAAGQTVVENDDGTATLTGTAVRVIYNEKIDINKDGFKFEFSADMPDSAFLMVSLTKAGAIRQWQNFSGDDARSGIINIFKNTTADGWSIQSSLSYDQAPGWAVHSTKPIVGDHDLTEKHTFEIRYEDKKYVLYMDGKALTIGTREVLAAHKADPSLDPEVGGNFGWLPGEFAEGAVLSIAMYDNANSGEEMELNIDYIGAATGAADDNNNDDNKAPDTGDNNAVSAIALTAVVCAIVAGGVVVFRRKRSTQH
ncbi:MAG: LPXTG cell wall anchor domain-containing protein [Oscillospiraceae bacterium]|nr:LPXTG cell wall anchor domain-containing protein [Oscillospiraceae bacterium]